MSRTCLSFNLVKGKTNHTIPKPTSVRGGTVSHNLVYNLKVNQNNEVTVINRSKEQALRNLMNLSNSNLLKSGGCGCGSK